MKQNETKYETIKNYYINLIRENKVSIGEQLPSENEIAESFKVSRHTVRQALSYLVQEGWIYKERGRGSFFSKQKEKDKIKNVAVLTTYISDYIFPTIISGIEEELRKKGYNLLLLSSNNNIESEEECIENIVDQDIAGLIMEPAQSNINTLSYDSMKRLQKKKVKLLTINSNCDVSDLAYIMVDDEQAGYRAALYLLELGHTNIAGIFKIDDLQGEKRRQGYLRALSEYNIEKNSAIIGQYITDNRDMYVDGFVRKIVNMKDRPSAIVCYNDQIALRVISVLRSEGISVPEDMSVTSFDDSLLAVSSEVKLTTIKHPQKDMGKQAAKCIIDMIEDRIEQPQYVYPVELIVRDSCKRI